MMNKGRSGRQSQEPDPEGLIGYGNKFALYANYEEKAVRTFPILMVWGK